MNLNRELLEAALLGLETKMARLQEQIAAIQGMTGGKGKPKAPRTVLAADDWESPMGLAAKAPATKRRKKRVLSPEARERIAAAQKKRWAAYRGEA